MPLAPPVAALLEEGRDRALSYAAYRRLVAESLEGAPLYDKESQQHFTRLNHQRMSRLDKTATLDEAAVDAVVFARPTLLLVLTEGWCGDAAHVLPVLNLLAERIDNLELGILFRDENPELMDAFLTGSSRSIPKVIVADAEWLQVRGVWGPRPAPAQAIFEAYRADPDIDYDTYQLELQKWYNRDRSVHIQRELLEVLRRSAG